MADPFVLGQKEEGSRWDRFVLTFADTNERGAQPTTDPSKYVKNKKHPEDLLVLARAWGGNKDRLYTPSEP